MTTPTPSARQAIDLNEAAKYAETVLDLIRFGASAFDAANISYGHGTQNAYDESVALVLWALHLPPDSPDILFSARVTPAEVASTLKAIATRVETRAPLGYITGEIWFRGLRFLSDSRALVPRSLLVEALQESFPDWVESNQAEWLIQTRESLSILDLCTGGGSIAIHAALQFPGAAVTAVDIDEQALELCRENLTLHGLSEQITLHHSDLLTDVATPDQFDLILSNPPYVPTESMMRLPAEYRSEPEIALIAGDDGMRVIRQILLQAKQRLTAHGILLLEIGHQIDEFVAAFTDLPFATLPVDAGDEMIVLITTDQLRHATI